MEKSGRKELNVAAQHVQDAIFQCWGNKQGGSVKNWKRRWFVLRDTGIWYFKQQKSTSAQGCIELDGATVIRDETGTFPGKDFTFSVKARNQKSARPDSPEGAAACSTSR